MMNAMPPSSISLNPPLGGANRQSLLIGVDPGLRRTGYAVVGPGGQDVRLIEAGVVRIETRLTLEKRLVQLETGLEELIEATRPGSLACEELYAHYRHPRTAILMAHARGVILALAARRGLDVVSVPATQVKKLLTGSGRASKVQMQRAVMAALRLERVPEPHDVADAIAIALCGQRLLAARRRLAAARPGPPGRAAIAGGAPA